MLSFTFLFGLAALLSPSIGEPLDVKSLQTLSVRQNNVSKALDWDPSQTPFPPAYRDNTSFTYTSASEGQVTVEDPYNWFEDVKGQQSQIEDFRKSQISFTRQYRDKVMEHDQIRAFFNEANNFTTFGLPQPCGTEHYLYWVSEYTSAFKVWYLASQTELDQGIASNFTQYPGTKLLDESLVGVNRTVSKPQISPDGKKLMYTVYETDTYAHLQTYFRDVSNPLTAENVKENIEGGSGHYSDVIPESVGTKWHPDSESIFYLNDHKDVKDNVTVDIDSIRYHKLGTDVKDDLILLPPPADTSKFYNVEVSNDLKYLLVIYGQQVNGKETVRWYAASLDQPIESFSTWKWLPITVDDSDDYFYLTNIEEDFYWLTCPNCTSTAVRSLIKISLDFSQAKQVANLIDDFTTNLFTPQEIVPNREDATISCWNAFDTNKALLQYAINGHTDFLIYDLVTGKELQNITFDDNSMIDAAESSINGKELYFSGSWLNKPVQLYKIDWNNETNQASPYQQFYETSSDYFKSEDYIVEMRSVPSTDGAEVPIWLFYHKDNKLDGSSAAYVEFYGGYGLDDLPGFDRFGFSFVHDFNGVYVISQIRGGGEVFGEYWHDAGKLENKHHSFEDLIATANYLVDQKFTSPGKILLSTQSSGAVTAGAVINEAPEGLIGAAIVERGIFDLLRLNGTSDTNIRIAEFGSAQDPKEFDLVYSYSPLQNINKDKQYPIVVLLPGTEYDTAQPWHSYKYLATLQYLHPSNPDPFFLTDSLEHEDEVKTQAFEILFHALGVSGPATGK